MSPEKREEPGAGSGASASARQPLMLAFALAVVVVIAAGAAIALRSGAGTNSATTAATTGPGPFLTAAGMPPGLSGRPVPPFALTSQPRHEPGTGVAQDDNGARLGGRRRIAPYTLDVS